MKNHVQRGDVITLITPNDVDAGGVVVVGDFIGIAATDAKAGAEVETALTEVFDLPKAAIAIAQGDGLYWSTANANVSKTASGNKFIGKATIAAAEGAATVPVRLAG